ncbi:MAG: ABC transporter substrate-binding protein [Pauljensenia sp.]
MKTRTIMGTVGIAAVSALVLGACSSGSAQSGESGESGSADGDITLTVATFNEFGYDDLYQEYMDSHPGIKVVAKKAATSNEARDNMNTRLSAGSGLSDIEAIEVDWLPELAQYPDEFTDLTSEDTTGRWLDWKTEAATVDGKLIGYGTDIGPEAICYRADLFEKAGLPTDRDEVAALLDGGWDKYFEVGKDFVSKTDIPWYDGATATYQGMINQVKNPFEQDDNTVIPLKDNTEIKGVYDDVLTASVDDNLSAHLSQWSEDWVNSFQKDGFATMLCPPWMLGVIEGNATGVTGWDVAPVFPGGGGNWGGSYLTVPAQGAHPEEAKELAAWLTAPEQQIKAFKSKGTFPSQVEALDDPELLDYTNEFFNNAPVGQIYSERAKAVTVQPHKGPNFFAITTIVTDAMTRVDVDKTDDAATSWDKAVTEFDQLGLE